MSDLPQPSKKRPYREPGIVTLGDAVALTGAVGTPVRDNPNNDTPHYYDASSKDKMTTVDLDD